VKGGVFELPGGHVSPPTAEFAEQTALYERMLQEFPRIGKAISSMPPELRGAAFDCLLEALTNSIVKQQDTAMAQRSQ